MGSHSTLYVLSALLIFLISVPILLVNAQSGSAASLALSQADDTLVSAHEAILEAEQEGANISSLLDQSNLAGEYLAEAYAWYRLGSYDKASQFAGLCSNAIKDVRNEAFELRDDAKKQGEATFFATIIISFAGVAAVVVFCSVAWIVFNRRYQRNLV